ncbi:hypothetical protein KGQ24_02945 [Patescibacteria group bacterium]|nr:hypothetical protein [Patescibacteria group bacterium]
MAQEPSINNDQRNFAEKLVSNKWAALIALIVIVAVAAALFVSVSSRKGKEYPKQYAATGQTVQGFPKDLIFDPITVTQSYTIPYPGQTQYTAEYDSTDFYGLAYLKALQYLKTNNFYINNQMISAGQGNDSSNLYGTKNDGTQINFVAIPNYENSKYSHVIISILSK